MLYPRGDDAPEDEGDGQRAADAACYLESINHARESGHGGDAQGLIQFRTEGGV